MPRQRQQLKRLKVFLDEQVALYNCPAFIEQDPISIPHRFRRQQDIEIAGLFAAIMAWGSRQQSIRCTEQLMERMDFAPYDFVVHHQPQDLRCLEKFYYRTFRDTDLLYFLFFLQHHYRTHHTLEEAFARHLHPDDPTVERALIGFHEDFFSLPEAPRRTRKHIPTPKRQSACKRINLFLRWMVRRDQSGVDFGLWRRVSPRQLVCPYDVHVMRIAERLGLVRGAPRWRTALALTEVLRLLDANDPVKYDFALFGLGMALRKNSFRL